MTARRRPEDDTDRFMCAGAVRKAMCDYMDSIPWYRRKFEAEMGPLTESALSREGRMLRLVEARETLERLIALEKTPDLRVIRGGGAQ
jgi:hypothetical protein